MPGSGALATAAGEARDSEGDGAVEGGQGMPSSCGDIDDDEGQRPVRIIRRGSGSVVTWRRAQMVLRASFTLSRWWPRPWPGCSAAA